ncbi:DEKNAAC105595 [Brettanomyces naardenensis]|uniref:DEKNAAC105595 n=1 Tax=Brettanomyces naardenensis TaxID=13370 RepID=A0A448YTX4_BRENA|nr:DEKNAAC105595 [Brettanomyces naardenensis]
MPPKIEIHLKNGRDIKDRKSDQRERPERAPIKYREREPKHVRKAAREKDKEEESEDVVEDSEDMMKMMGFSGFGSTKNKKVEGTDCYGVRKVQKTEYRQYMNREKGFNRPLSPTREDKKGKKVREDKEKEKDAEAIEK